MQEDNTTTTDRDLIIVHTALAESYSRWAEAYKNNDQLGLAIEKALLGLEAMKTASTFGSSDVKAFETEIKCQLLLGRLYRKMNDTEKSLYYLYLVINQDERVRVWTPPLKRYYLQGCYYLIITLVEIGEFDINKVYGIYQRGKDKTISDPNFDPKYTNLELLFDQDNRYTGKFMMTRGDKGYGFIECPEADTNNVFAHISDVLDEITDFSKLIGCTVSFSLYRTDRGSSAKAILILPQ